MSTPLGRRSTPQETRVRSGLRPVQRPDRRAIARFKTDCSAQIEWKGRVLDVLISDLGIGGLFVRSPVSPPYGEHVVVVAMLDQRKIRLGAVVRWGDERGFGAQFDALGALDAASVIALVARKRRGAAASKK